VFSGLSFNASCRCCVFYLLYDYEVFLDVLNKMYCICTVINDDDADDDN